LPGLPLLSSELPVDLLQASLPYSCHSAVWLLDQPRKLRHGSADRYFTISTEIYWRRMTRRRSDVCVRALLMDAARSGHRQTGFVSGVGTQTRQDKRRRRTQTLYAAVSTSCCRVLQLVSAQAVSSADETRLDRSCTQCVHERIATRDMCPS